MYLIAGLGNPGSRYRHTRHNVGFKVINLWGKILGVRLVSRRFQSRNTKTRFQNKDIILLRPLTFMNNSGRSVKACADMYHLRTGNILIVHDDIDLPVGRIRVARNGGAGGHKGVSSIIHHLGTRAFPRVRIGIGRPWDGESVEDFVLSPLYPDEIEIMENAFQLAVQACELFVTDGVEIAMNRINSQHLATRR